MFTTQCTWHNVRDTVYMSHCTWSVYKISVHIKVYTTQSTKHCVHSKVYITIVHNTHTWHIYITQCTIYILYSVNNTIFIIQNTWPKHGHCAMCTIFSIFKKNVLRILKIKQYFKNFRCYFYWIKNVSVLTHISGIFFIQKLLRIPRRFLSYKI